MATVVLRTSLNHYFKIYEKLFYASPLTWCTRTQVLKTQPNSRRMTTWALIYFFTFLSYLYLFGLLITHIFYPFLYPGHVVMLLIGILGFSLSLIYNTFLYFDSHIILEIIIATLELDAKFADKYIHHSERTGFRPMEKSSSVFHLTTTFAMAMTPIAAVIVLFYEFSPVVWTIENIFYPIDSFIVRVLLVPGMTYACIHLWSPILLVSYYIIGYLHFVERWLQIITAIPKNGEDEFLKTKKFFRKNPLVAVRAYRKLRLLNEYINCSVAHGLSIVPLIVIVPGLMGALCSFVTAKMREMITMPSYAGFPLLFLIIVILEGVGIRGAASIRTESKRFKEGKNRYEDEHYRRAFESCYPLKMDLGPFTTFKRETALAYLHVMAFYTLSLIIAVKLKS